MQLETRVHDKEQELGLLAKRYDKQLRSLEQDLEEHRKEVRRQRDTCNDLSGKLQRADADLEKITKKKEKYHALSEKYNKMNTRLTNEKTALEKQQEELTSEIQRLELLAQQSEMAVDFPQSYDNDLLELAEAQQEESYGEEQEGEGEEPAEEAPGEESLDMANESFNELSGLDGLAMNAAPQQDYVETSQHDMRRSKVVNLDMVNKLNR